MKYHDLIEFYSIIIRELNIKIKTTDGISYIDNFNCNYGRFVLLHSDFFAMNHIGKHEIHFNPLSNNQNECSLLLIEDAVYKKIEYNIQKEFETIVKSKYINNELNYHYSINKFNYIFRTAKVPFSKNIIKFIYKICEYDCKITLEYSLFKFLSTQNKNIIFGVHLADYELEIFKDAYKSIIDTIGEEFQYTFKIPTNSIIFPEFYILFKIYSQINECFTNGLNRMEGRLDNLNDFYFDSYKFSDYILRNNDNEKYKKYITQLIQHEKHQYKEELKIRQSYTTDWLLLKDNDMKTKEEEKNENSLITQDEISKKFDTQYLNTYNKKIALFNASNDVKRYISDQHYMNNNKEYAELLGMQELVLSIINGEDGRLWFDNRKNKYCFRSEYGGKIVENDKKEMTNILNKVMQKHLPKYHNFDTNSFNYIIEVVLIESISDISKQKIKDEHKANNVVKVLLFTSAIPAIDGEVFDITRNEEIFESDNDLLFKRNRFIPTKYLAKRYENRINIQHNQEKSFIQNFIFQMLGADEKKFSYILNWLAYCYQELKPTGLALVFLGEQEVSNDLFFKRIIIEIFGKLYCSNIDDNSDYKTALIQDVAKDKLFLNVGTINDAGTQFDDKSLTLLIKELLIQPKIAFTNDNNEQEELVLHSQVLITATNPAPYLKKALSKCSIFNITDIDTIMANLELEDEIELEDKILKDLDYFSDFLNCYQLDEQRAVKKLVTEEREFLKDKITETNINKEDLDSKIDDFIQAIINKNLEYFVKVNGNNDKQGKDIYIQLKNTFEKDEGYFIGQDMFLYYNAIHGQSFKTNKSLMDILKEKDDMFKQEVKTLKVKLKDDVEEVLFQAPKTSKETGNKELYKITNYTLIEDIIIPSKAIIISSLYNLKKFTYADDETLKLNEDYQAKLAQEKKANK